MLPSRMRDDDLHRMRVYDPLEYFSESDVVVPAGFQVDAVMLFDRFDENFDLVPVRGSLGRMQDAIDIDDLVIR